MKSIIWFILVSSVLTACTTDATPPSTSTPISTSTVNLTVEIITPTPTAIVIITPTPIETPTPIRPTEIEPTPTEELIKISINQENPYQLISTISQEELESASDQELLDTAPSFAQNQDFQEYGFDEVEVNELNPTGEVIKVGEQRFVPYNDQDGKMRMWWNVEKGDIEHSEYSEYIDPETDFKVKTYVVTDNSWNPRMNERIKNMVPRYFIWVN